MDYAGGGSCIELGALSAEKLVSAVDAALSGHDRESRLSQIKEKENINIATASGFLDLG